MPSELISAIGLSSVFAALLGAVAVTGSIAAAAASVASPAPSASGAPTQLRFVPQINYEYWALESTRPRDSAALRVAIGLFDSYSFVEIPLVQTLTLKDTKTGKTTDFLLSTSTTLNGTPLPCLAARTVGNERFCEKIPTDTFPNGTYVAVLFWPAIFSGRTYLATDTVVSIPP